MSDNSIRINTKPNGADKYIKLKLDQEFDFIEILSLKITQEDAYRNFCADYGVVAGRVIVNSGFGVPNAKVSIFIPVDDIDSLDPEILGLYPYEIVGDKNSDGVRYNLLPATSDSGNECHTPIGTFPSKRQILDNPTVLQIYQKYYKFTTTTNFAGDYMIFGVPIGNYIIHVDADISDIGIISQRPYDSISQGASPKLFDSSTKYKGGTNLDKLVQIKSANAAVNVEPFWGNSDNCEIGINRVDLDLNYTVIPSAIFMGSIWGDTDKNSVNKNCIPRRKLGEICDQATGEGSIEMIRETVDGKIERFDIEGGRVIDDNGSWAYQIPMNLDYFITDENGGLIPSDDPNKGLPTRANVRFRVSMDQTGGEGRLRTRAKHLVPHNPNIPAEIDYEFSEKTKKSSLRSIHWNKIYTVSNFISRFQKTNPLTGGLQTRNSTGVKNVDGCGDKTPFPFNRVNTTFNPIFFIICLIIKILGSLIYVINALLIPILNAVLKVINVIFKAICDVINTIIGFIRKICKILHISRPSKIDCGTIGLIGCIYVKCPFDENSALYAPGCSGSSDGYKELSKSGNAPTYYDGDKFGHGGFFDLVGLDDCIAFEMARTLALFEFDFYNDWINGSLYAFLLKYKRKRRGRERFCEYDCKDFGISAGGVDGDKNGSPDNNCFKNNIVDSCFINDSDDAHKNLKSKSVREGVIKKYKDEFYYAASTHNASDKLFSTELVNLGAVFNCDWQTVPKLQQYLIPTTYNIPPTIQEVDDDQTTVLTTGQCDIDGNTVGLFFSINCLGLHVNDRQCLNIRHLCEFGVELDEFRDDIPPDGVIGKKDLDLDDADRPKWFRDIFAGLNYTANTWNLSNLPYTTNFNNRDAGVYNFASSGTSVIVNGVQDGSINGDKYIGFRGYPLNIDNALTQPKHSYYFYFGLLPGKTALDKMNQNFFAVCPAKPTTIFDVEVVTTAAKFSDASSSITTITFLNGTGPITGKVSGPVGYTANFVVGANNTPPVYVITGLVIGSYTITGTDARGNVVTESFVVSPPPSIYGDAIVSSNSTNSLLPNGKITITSIGGGSTNSSGQYNYKLYNSKGGVVSEATFSSIPTNIENLKPDTVINTTFKDINVTGYGYTLVLSDSAMHSIYIPNLPVIGATPLIVTVTSPLNIACFGQLGTLTIDVTGGLKPYDIKVTGQTSGDVFAGQSIADLPADTYLIRVTDSLGTINTSTSKITNLSTEMVIEKVDEKTLSNQCSPDFYNVGFLVTKGGKANEKVYIQYSTADPDNGDRVFIPAIPLEFTFVSDTTPIFLKLDRTTVADSIVVRMTNSTATCFSPELEYDIFEIELPPNNLTVNDTQVDNKKLQCTLGKVNIKFNISHFNVGTSSFTPRTPYTVTYTVISKVGSATRRGNTKTDKTVSSNQELITLDVPLINSVNATSCSVEIQVTDSSGCKSTNMLTIKDIPLPSSVLTGKWDPVTFSSGNYNYVFKATGGIPNYTAQIYEIGKIYKYPNTVVLTSTVTDSVGCTSTKASNQ